VPLEPSAPAHRVVDVVSYLAASAGVDVSVSEIARGAGVNRTTCQAILLSLEARGWVQRRGAGSYGLGPAMIPLGEAALGGMRLVDEVRPELDALVDELQMEALASVVSGDEIVVVAHARRGSVLANTVRVGQTMPFVPPFGLGHLLHAPRERVDAWLDRAPVKLDARDRAEYRAVIDVAEQRGYVVVLDAESRRRFQAVMAELAERPASVAARRRRDALIASLARDEATLGPWTGSESAEVSQISAPVFGPDGRPALAIGVHGLPHQIDAARLPDYAERVLAAAARVTKRVGGRQPHRGGEA
jgi:DNA-binding IclR family transcriptional regulator